MSSAKWRPFCLGLNVLMYKNVDNIANFDIVGPIPQMVSEMIIQMLNYMSYAYISSAVITCAKQ